MYSRKFPGRFADIQLKNAGHLQSNQLCHSFIIKPEALENKWRIKRLNILLILVCHLIITCSETKKKKNLLVVDTSLIKFQIQ